jgi:transposase
MGILIKKTLHPKEQQREDVAEKRKAWSVLQKEIDFDKLVFLDESSVNCGMTRYYGRSLTSERVNEYVKDSRFEQTTIISTIRLDNSQVPFLFKGPINGEIFSVYIQEMLVNTLHEGDILVLDNLSVHKVSGALEPLRKKGVSIMFLPPYSPDYNPIEMKWSKMKSKLRELKPRTLDELESSMKIALDSVTQTDIENWFKHCGYIR